MATQLASRGRAFRALLLALAVALPLLTISPILAGTFSQESFRGRTYWLYVPGGYQAGTAVPLVVMLHGCTQSGNGFATSTGMNTVAEAETFLVIYPEQSSSANASRCWNWFEPAHQARGVGEPDLIAGMVGDVRTSFSVDDERVYAAGFSAGAAMAVILGATYPDVFAALGVHSGLEYKAATSATAAFTAMFSGGPPADPQGRLAFDAMGRRARVMPVIVFHGTSDFTVVTANGDLVLSQWAQTDDLASDGVDQNDIDDIAEGTESGQVPGGRTFTRSLYEDGTGRVILEKYRVDGMGHNWSGGVPGGSFTDPDGPDASQLIWDFFAGSEGAADTTAPVTTASPAGGTYAAALDVTLAADEPATTFYTVDGSAPTTSSTVFSIPIRVPDDTTLRFFSVDVAGNSEAIQSEVYVIDAASDTTPPLTTAAPAGGSYASSVDVVLTATEPATTFFTDDGSTPTTSSAVFTGPISIAADTTLRFFSVDAAGNQETVKSEIYTFPVTRTLLLTSIDAEDGYAGQLFVDGASTSLHRAGDKGFFNVDSYRLILSFDPSALPAGATVTAAQLTVFRESQSGTVSSLTADIADGVFGGGAELVQSDHSAAATQVGAFGVAVPTAGGGSTTTDLPSSTLGLIPGNRFQIRLRATTSANFASDVLVLHGGGAGSLAPTLELTYE